MKFLIDTHCWIWWFLSPEKLNDESFKHIQNPHHEVILSIASAWEMSIKYGLGKLHLPLPAGDYIPKMLFDQKMSSLPIILEHALRAGELPNHHRDPFDRLIVSQAMVEKIPIMTADAKLKKYDVKIIWASAEK